MWAATTLSCKLWLPATVTATGNRGHFTVSARNTRPRKNINYNYEDEEEEINNEQELEVLQEQEIGDLDGFQSNSTKISGSAVLLALQKASAKKTSKKITKKKKKQSNFMKEERNQGDAIADYSDVKELCIKSDWKDRLDEIESQINELIHNI